MKRSGFKLRVEPNNIQQVAPGCVIIYLPLGSLELKRAICLPHTHSRARRQMIFTTPHGVSCSPVAILSLDFASNRIAKLARHVTLDSCWAMLQRMQLQTQGHAV